MRIVIVDALARVRGERKVTVDVIGVGPRAVAGIILFHRITKDVDIYPAEKILKKPVILKEYDIMMVSAMSSDEIVATKLIKLWRVYRRGLAILGGPITSKIEIVKQIGYDYGVYGEAEQSLPKLLQMIINNEEGETNIPGIIPGKSKNTSFIKPTYTPRDKLNYFHPPFVRNYPAYWASRIYVEAVRGCSNYRRPLMKLPSGNSCIKCPVCFNPRTPLRARLHCPAKIPAGCGYCSVPELYGPARSRDSDLIVKEIKALINEGASRIVLSAPDILDYGRDLLVEPEPLTDPCQPRANISKLKELFKNIWKIPEIESGEVHVMLENIKACLVDESVAKTLSEYFRRTPIHIGAESGDNNHLKLLGRPAYTEDILKAVKLLSENDIEPYVYFIYGLPGETAETVNKTLRFMDELAQNGAAKMTVYRFRPLPGTAFERVKPLLTEHSLRIKKKAIELNMSFKQRLIGTKTKAIIVGYSSKRHMLIAYPLPHGPVIIVHGSKNLIGWIVEVKIVDVISDREVLGVVTKKLKNIRPKVRHSIIKR